MRAAQELGDRPLHLEVHLYAVGAHLGLPHLREDTSREDQGQGGAGGLRLGPRRDPALTRCWDLPPKELPLSPAQRTQNTAPPHL